MAVREKQISCDHIEFNKDISFDDLLQEFVDFAEKASYKQTLQSKKESSECVIVEDERRLFRFKLLQFCEDIRPPYFGTWSKVSTNITGRKPLALDNTHLDYEIDSEAEWEEDEVGEELRSEDDNEEEDSLLEEEENDVCAFIFNFRDGWFLTDTCRMMRALKQTIQTFLISVNVLY
jgi:hypothetical protein